MCQLSINRLACARIPTSQGEFQLCLYSNNRDEKEHLALVMGEVRGQEQVLLRVHSECYTGDVLGSLRCDCGEQLHAAMAAIAEAGSGVLVYLRQEGRGIGLLDKLRAYNLQDQGYDTVDANLLLGHEPDERDYLMAACILEELGPASVRVLTNNPEKIQGLRENGIQVTGRIPLAARPTQENAAYLRAKAERLNHLLSLHLLETSDDLQGRDGRRTAA
jgi:3,4-dihydroxy 2-butanone 4-phosphate synthase/GTP cyclohydrolase II